MLATLLYAIPYRSDLEFNRKHGPITELQVKAKLRIGVLQVRAFSIISMVFQGMGTSGHLGGK